MSKAIEEYSTERRKRVRPIQKDAIYLSLSGQKEIASPVRAGLRHMLLYYTLSSKSQEVRANRMARFIDELKESEQKEVNSKEKKETDEDHAKTNEQETTSDRPEEKGDSTNTDRMADSEKLLSK